MFDEIPSRLREVVTGYLDHLAVERGAAKSTLASYTRDLRRYTDHLGSAGLTDLSEVEQRHLAAFLAELRDGRDGKQPLARSSIARTVVAVRGFHRFAHAEGFVVEDVAREVSPPSPPQHLPKALPIADVTRLLEALGGDKPRGLRDRALLELLYSTGARISEAVGLDADDVDAVGRTVLLAGKGGRQRLVPLGKPALEALEAYLVRARPNFAVRGRGSPALFLNSRGTRLSRQSAWNAHKRAGEQAGVEIGVSPHVLRHSFATHLLEGGADVRVVQELLGHASVTTTQVYTLVTVNTLREVYATTHPRARE